MTNIIDKFVNEYKPGKERVKPDKELLDFGRQMLPKEIMTLWEEYGNKKRIKK